MRDRNSRSIRTFGGSINGCGAHGVDRRFLGFSSLPSGVSRVRSFCFFRARRSVRRVFTGAERAVDRVARLLDHFLPRSMRSAGTISPLSIRPKDERASEALPTRRRTFCTTLAPSASGRVAERGTVRRLRGVTVFFERSRPADPIPCLLRETMH